jgi:hypothetical protein
MNQNELKTMQRRIGVLDDGFWGPKSIAACQAHLRKLMPSPNPWPASDQNSLSKFYGRAGDESKLVPIDVSDLGLKYDGKPVKLIRCHGKVGASLRRVLEAIAKSPNKYVLTRYAGCYNNRVMRGGSLPSLHARGAAVDIDPDDNASYGTYNVLWQIYQAQTLNLSHLYLGYWIEQSQKMNYKTNFKPLELLEDGVWKALPSVKK